MCLLIVKQPGARLPKEHIKQGWSRNKDGGGLAWHDKDGLSFIKGYFEFDHFWEEIEKHQDASMIIHVRWATHGSKVQENCHPFLAGGGWIMGHNGVLSGQKVVGDQTDTAAFIRDYIEPTLSQHPKALLEDGKWKKALKKATIGSKLAFLNTKGQSVIIHEEAGIWDKGIWYSNGAYKPWVPAPVRYITPEWQQLLNAYKYGEWVNGPGGPQDRKVWDKNPESLDEYMERKGWARGKYVQWVPKPKAGPLNPCVEITPGVWTADFLGPADICDCCEEPFGSRKAFWLDADEAFVCSTCKELVLDGENYVEAEATEVKPDNEVLALPAPKEPDNIVQGEFVEPEEPPAQTRFMDDGPHYMGSEDDSEVETGDYYRPGVEV